MHMSLSKLWELVMDREAWRAVVHRVTAQFNYVEKMGSTAPWDQVVCLLEFY